LDNTSQINAKQNASLTCLITEEEINQVIDNMPNNKSPGVDGLTYEFYKDTKDLIIPILTKLFNNILEEGHIPNSWSTSLITLIPKKDDDLTKVNNWRPISLVNTDAKIFIKILANRLNPICDIIIGAERQAFIAKRSIADSALDVLMVLRNQTNQSKQQWLLLLDQQKAFDRVNHQFIQKK
jgi:hypothetical protein